MNVRSSDPLLGCTLDDRYRIVRWIARGGMATVFEAVDERLSRTVAVKVMHPGLDTSRDIAARFDTEARSAALLQHPNVVAVFDQGVAQGRPYIVMEHVRGITLRQLITLEAPFEAGRALQLFEPICSALAAAHDAGIIHRDIKPENVLISERGQVKVADFGLARNVTGTEVVEGNVVIGTVSYIAPELVSRGQASPRSDVYSLGIMLYELLTGLKPYRNREPIEIAYAHVHNDVPPPSHAPVNVTIPPYLDVLVGTATARTLQQRQCDAGVVLRQVRSARQALTQGVTDPAALNVLMRAESSTQVERALTRLHQPATGRASEPARQLASSGQRTARASERGRPSASRAPLPPAHDIRLTPSNVGSPTFDMVDDGIPYRADGASPMSPHSPPRSPLTSPVVPRAALIPAVVPPRREWNQEPMYRRRRLAVGAASLALFGALVGGTWWGTTGHLPATPVAVGATQAQAQDALAAAGLTVEFAREYSDTVPSGQVTRTDPAQGTRVQPGSVIVVYLSAGHEQVSVPKLVGQPRDEALRRLDGAGLRAGAITEEYSAKPAGTVLRQSSASATSLAKGSSVDLVLSRGREQADLPDVVNQPQLDARTALTEAGFHVRVQMDYAEALRGTVVSQDPGPGQAAKGSTITIVVSRGPRV